ncbi:unnamed protein product [Caenorhabditis bovis]|uniref:Ubiquitin carboxyl-terminal hydrolase n=1 Tax=Caenorhabditis bovis TaxID=2654633 RepID=A0A8S1ETU3_9PELO|nr:unnamed protein product [Caenorhabditis bovis]
MADAGNWCLIESDPGIFTEMIEGFGVKGMQVEELYSVTDLDETLPRPVYGLIFLFKYRSGDVPAGQFATDGRIFFAQQVINNACATQAIINMLMNVNDPNIELGPVLKEYKEFANEFDASTRGLCLSNCEEIRKVHNSFARQTLYELDQKGESSEDNYHFVTYVPVGGKVYELDGLREYPIIAADIPDGKDWLEAIGPVIQDRMEKYSEGEIHFNLMAVIPNRKTRYEEDLAKLLANPPPGVNIQDQVAELRQGIADEEYKAALYRKENIRRRHNYLPFIIELLKILAKEGKLLPLVDAAIKQAKDRAGIAERVMAAELKRKQ